MTSETPGVICPHCLSFAWEHDGFEVAADGPVFRAERLADEPDGRPWHCQSCGHDLQNEALSQALDRVAEAHWA